MVTHLCGLKAPGSVDGGTSVASLRYPTDMAMRPDGSIVIADCGNHLIRVLEPKASRSHTFSVSSPDIEAGTPPVWTLRTLAGCAQCAPPAADGNVASTGGYSDGVGSDAKFKYPTGVAIDGDGHILVVDHWNHCIRRIDRETNSVSTLAGTPGTSGSSDGPANVASFNFPIGICCSWDNTIFVSDSNNHIVRQIKDGQVSTIAGSPKRRGSVDGFGGAARFRYPAGIAVSLDGHVYVCDCNNHSIRRINLANGEVSTYAGQSGRCGLRDSTASKSALFKFPFMLNAVSTGALVVADRGNHSIRVIKPNGDVVTIAGAAARGMKCGKSTTARFSGPFGAIFDDARNSVHVADTCNHVLRSVYVVQPHPIKTTTTSRPRTTSRPTPKRPPQPEDVLNFESTPPSSPSSESGEAPHDLPESPFLDRPDESGDGDGAGPNLDEGVQSDRAAAKELTKILGHDEEFFFRALAFYPDPDQVAQIILENGEKMQALRRTIAEERRKAADEEQLAIAKAMSVSHASVAKSSATERTSTWRKGKWPASTSEGGFGMSYTDLCRFLDKKEPVEPPPIIESLTDKKLDGVVFETPKKPVPVEAKLTSKTLPSPNENMMVVDLSTFPLQSWPPALPPAAPKSGPTCAPSITTSAKTSFSLDDSETAKEPSAVTPRDAKPFTVKGSFKVAPYAMFALDPSRCSRNIELSDCLRTATSKSSQKSLVLGSRGFSTGVHYWEVKIRKCAGGGQQYGEVKAGVFLGVAEKVCARRPLIGFFFC